MWVLFGTNHHTVENEPRVFFIGIFHSLELANRNKEYVASTLFNRFFCQGSDDGTFIYV